MVLVVLCFRLFFKVLSTRTRKVNLRKKNPKIKDILAKGKFIITSACQVSGNVAVLYSFNYQERKTKVGITTAIRRQALLIQMNLTV